MKNKANIKGDGLHVMQDESGNKVTQGNGNSYANLNGDIYKWSIG